MNTIVSLRKGCQSHNPLQQFACSVREHSKTRLGEVLIVRERLIDVLITHHDE